MIVKLITAKPAGVAMAVSAGNQLRPLAIELLNPVAFTLFAMAVWSLMSSLGLMSAIPFRGPLAHWMFWLAAGIAARVCEATLRRRLEV